MAAHAARSAAGSLGPKPLQLTQSLEVTVDLREVHLRGAWPAGCCLGGAGRGLGGRGALQSQVLRDLVDERVAERGLAGEEALEQGVVADAVDDARGATRVLVCLLYTSDAADE